FNDTATTEIYTLSLHDALPISVPDGPCGEEPAFTERGPLRADQVDEAGPGGELLPVAQVPGRPGRSWSRPPRCTPPHRARTRSARSGPSLNPQCWPGPAWSRPGSWPAARLGRRGPTRSRRPGRC